jgi:hypothetical protein
METLLEIARRYGTDKANHGFCPFYDSAFASIRNERVRLLEVGIYRGASLRMWRDYFPLGSIVGIDSLSELLFTEDRIETYCHNSREIASFLDEREPFDIIVDDGRHTAKSMLQVFNDSWPRIRSGGFHVIEDLHCPHGTQWKRGSNYNQSGDNTPSELVKAFMNGDGTFWSYVIPNDAFRKHAESVKAASVWGSTSMTSIISKV